MINASITYNIQYCFLMRKFKIYLSSYFEIYNELVLTIATLPYNRASNLFFFCLIGKFVHLY